METLQVVKIVALAIRTAAGEEASVVLDLGDAYLPSQFEKLILGYSNPRTYAADTKVELSLDGENYTTVAENNGYSCKKDNAGTADLNIINLDKLSDYTESLASGNAIRNDSGCYDFSLSYCQTLVKQILGDDYDESTSELNVSLHPDGLVKDTSATESSSSAK